ncbi:MAG: S41 family peptidase, partial [Bacteroidota bacterium]
MKIRLLLLMTVHLIGDIHLKAQGYDCLGNLDFVINHIEKNYPGFADKVTSENLIVYQDFKKKSLNKASTVQNKLDCLEQINEFIAFFKDGHIQIFDLDVQVENRYLYPNRQTSESPLPTSTVEFQSLTPNTSYLRISSFNEREFNSIESIIRQNEIGLKNSKNIIIDLRGNEGGATFTYAPILPYLGLDSIEYIGFDVLATEDNIASYAALL